jgi:PTH1 family peptidyl-tRNA hydrolase
LTATFQLIVGLGNPGPPYAQHRHNVGFWVVDRLPVNGTWSRESRFKADVARSRIGNHNCWLMKPQTFMNLSGEAVGAFVRFHRMSPAEVLVIHDELDLPPGGVRIKQGGGHGGHNGVRSIESHLGSPDFWRLRVGIGHPRTLGLAQEVADFVLHPPRREEQPAIDHAVDEILREMPALVNGEVAAVQRRLHML